MSVGGGKKRIGDTGQIESDPEFTNPIVGHKTFHSEERGYWHEPLRKEEADMLLARAQAQKDERAKAMPTEEDAIRALSDAYTRLTELGWDNIIYCPKDGSIFDAIEPGCSSVTQCSYMGECPSGHWWSHAEGDSWPARPCLYRKVKSA